MWLLVLDSMKNGKAPESVRENRRLAADLRGLTRIRKQQNLEVSSVKVFDLLSVYLGKSAAKASLFQKGAPKE
ncbi:MAG: hypothetical protein QOE77_401 [Blastocatellia bacterium]|nr:hypothetical protein [Blastocatellia bacterium]